MHEWRNTGQCMAVSRQKCDIERGALCVQYYSHLPIVDQHDQLMTNTLSRQLYCTQGILKFVFKWSSTAGSLSSVLFLDQRMKCVFIYWYIQDKIYLQGHTVILINLHSKLCVIVVLCVCTNKLYLLHFVMFWFI